MHSRGVETRFVVPECKLASSSMCKEISCVSSGLIVVLSQLEHFTVEAICWPWNNCEIGSLMSLIRAISNSWASTFNKTDPCPLVIIDRYNTHTIFLYGSTPHLWVYPTSMGPPTSMGLLYFYLSNSALNTW